MSGELGGAHDTEVMGERCAAMLAELPDELILGPVAAAVTRSFQCRQANPPCTRPAARRGRRELLKRGAAIAGSCLAWTTGCPSQRASDATSLCTRA